MPCQSKPYFFFYKFQLRFCILISQAAYDAGQKATEMEGILTFLSDSIHVIQVTDGFRDVLKPRQLDDADCAALNLSSAVTVYLAMAIQYFNDESIG